MLWQDWLQRRDHIPPVLYNLHRLSVHARITFKVLLTPNKALNGITSAYMTELLHAYRPVNTLCSSSSNLLVKYHGPKQSTMVTGLSLSAQQNFKTHCQPQFGVQIA